MRSKLVKLAKLASLFVISATKLSINKYFQKRYVVESTTKEMLLLRKVFRYNLVNNDTPTIYPSVKRDLLNEYVTLLNEAKVKEGGNINIIYTNCIYSN